MPCCHSMSMSANPSFATGNRNMEFVFDTRQSQRMCACELSAHKFLSPSCLRFVIIKLSVLSRLSIELSHSKCSNTSRDRTGYLCLRRNNPFFLPSLFYLFSWITLSHEIPRDLDNFILLRLFLPCHDSSFSLLTLFLPLV